MWVMHSLSSKNGLCKAILPVQRLNVWQIKKPRGLRGFFASGASPDRLACPDWRSSRHAERRVERLHELGYVDGLGQIAQEAGVEAFAHVTRQGVGRQGDDGDVRRQRIDAQQAQHLGAADAGQVDIHQDQVGLVLARQRDAEVAIDGAEHAQVAAAGDQLLDQDQVGRIVLHVQHLAARRIERRISRWLPAHIPACSPSCSSGADEAANSIQNSVLTPTSLSTPSVPPISSTSCLVTTRPMPVPSSVPASCPSRLNGWNNCCNCSALRPLPVSRTLRRTLSPRGLQSTSTLPSARLYLIAFDSRLMTTCLTRVKSACT